VTVVTLEAPVIQAMLGMAAGENFTLANGLRGKIAGLL
jgi:hypothetical protein